jgi:hypothetical protein
MLDLMNFVWKRVSSLVIYDVQGSERSPKLGRHRFSQMHRLMEQQFTGQQQGLLRLLGML